MRTIQDYDYLRKIILDSQRAFKIPQETVDYVMKMYFTDKWVNYCEGIHRSYGAWLLDVLDGVDLITKRI